MQADQTQLFTKDMLNLPMSEPLTYLDHEVSFPNTNITLRLQSEEGQFKNLIIKAPRPAATDAAETQTGLIPEHFIPEGCSSATRHQIRNHLNAINLGAHLFQRLMELGRTDDLDETLNRLLSELIHLDSLYATTHKIQASESSPVAGQKLLVVAAEHDRDVLVGLLNLYGLQVEQACSVHEALADLEDMEAVDGILLDLQALTNDDSAIIEQFCRTEASLRPKLFALAPIFMEEETPMSSLQNCDAWLHRPLNPQFLIEALIV